MAEERKISDDELVEISGGTDINIDEKQTGIPRIGGSGGEEPPPSGGPGEPPNEGPMGTDADSGPGDVDLG